MVLPHDRSTDRFSWRYPKRSLTTPFRRHVLQSERVVSVRELGHCLSFAYLLPNCVLFYSQLVRGPTSGGGLTISVCYLFFLPFHGDICVINYSTAAHMDATPYGQHRAGPQQQPLLLGLPNEPFMRRPHSRQLGARHTLNCKD